MFIRNVAFFSMVTTGCLLLAACGQGNAVIATDNAKKQENISEKEAVPKNLSNEKEPEKDEDSPNENTYKQDDESTSEDNTPKQQKPIPPDQKLKKGDRGNAVKRLQKAVNKLGYSQELDGIYNSTMVWVMKDFQAQVSELKTDGVYGTNTKVYLKKALKGSVSINPGTGLNGSDNKQDNTDKQDEKGTDEQTDGNNKETNPDKDTQNQDQIVSNPSSILVLVNKTHQLPEGYVPNNLVEPRVKFPFTEDLPKRLMRQPAASALENMFAAANQAGVDLFAQSGYRSYNRQEAIFASNVRQHGKKAANQFSAQPGESEHQTGLTMDVTSPDVDFRLITEFANTDEGKWVQKHASEYGFIIRYPKGKTSITGYQYEPWHLRYVGQKAAKAIDRQNITLEQYLGEQ